MRKACGSLLRPIVACLASVAFLASTALPELPPDTCDMEICGGYLPAGGYSASCSGYCINASCLTKYEVIAGDDVYTCYCRESSDSDAFTDRETNTSCRGKITFAAAGGIAFDCEKVLCRNPCQKLVAPLPAPGDCAPICLCVGGN